MFILSFLVIAASGCATGPRAPNWDDPPATAATAPAVVRSAAVEASDAAIMAVSLVGTPYAAGGGSPENGFDCSGLVAYVFARAAQARLPRNTFDLANAGAAVAPGELQAGDLVFYNTQRRPFSHVGIYLGQSRFVHAPSTGGAVRIEDMGGRYWSQRFDGARRLSF
jgi:cell wall-associated NlpC family hydrolase